MVLNTLSSLRLFWKVQGFPSLKTPFLGVIVDRRFTGAAHFRYLINKCRKILDVLTSLSGVWWGSHPQLLLTLYRAMFRSVIEYGCQIFGLEGNRTTFNIINRMQYQAFRVAYGYRGSTLINILHCEACEPPLRARMAIVSRRYIFRCLSNPRGPALNYLLSCKWAMLASSQSTREKNA